MARDPDEVTWRELLAETAELLADPQHARWVCETATSTSPSEFRELLDAPATERAVAHLDAMVARARTGEPIQYVLGSWAFRHLDLAVDARALIPRPETEDVASWAIELASAAGPIRTVADLGTGSGAIGLSMAHELPVDGTTVWLTDTSSDALDLARSNLAGIGRGSTSVRLAVGSWCDALPHAPGFDVIVSNPPYVAVGSDQIELQVTEWEPAQALFAGVDGLDDIRIIADSALDRLRPGGWLVLEHGHDQAEQVREILAEAGFVDVQSRRDLAEHERATAGCRSLDLFAVEHADGSLRVRHLSNTVADVAQLHAWLNDPAVLEWYEGRDRPHDLAEILRKYGPGGVLELDEVIPAIIELDGEPVGYVQYYELDDDESIAEFELNASGDHRVGDGDGVDAWSLDLFIGEPALFGRGIGRTVVRASAEFLIDVWGATDVLIMPYVDNARAVAAYRAAGFGHDYVVRLHEEHEGVMRDGLRMTFTRES